MKITLPPRQRDPEPIIRPLGPWEYFLFTAGAVVLGLVICLIVPNVGGVGL